MVMEVTKEFIPKNEDEKIIEIELERLRSFKNHPFQVKDDKEMYLLKESIEKYVLKRKSGRKKGQIDHKTKKKRTVEIISEECGDSLKQVQRYISLTRLIPEFLEKLDDELISFNPAVEVSYLKE
jgi:hypothetical protein